MAKVSPCNYEQAGTTAHHESNDDDDDA